jgi:GMP synthase-like glutamine amidotransferase
MTRRTAAVIRQAHFEGLGAFARPIERAGYAIRARDAGVDRLPTLDPVRTGLIVAVAGHPVLHWHGDTFDLPQGADRLASTAVGEKQAFAYGRTALGFQFHPEADGRGLERRLIGHAVEIAAAGLSAPVLRADTERFAAGAAARGRACVAEWLRELDP